VIGNNFGAHNPASGALIGAAQVPVGCG